VFRTVRVLFCPLGISEPAPVACEHAMALGLLVPWKVLPRHQGVAVLAGDKFVRTDEFVELDFCLGAFLFAFGKGSAFHNPVLTCSMVTNCTLLCHSFSTSFSPKGTLQLYRRRLNSLGKI
jgi:hypothetical protein